MADIEGNKTEPKVPEASLGTDIPLKEEGSSAEEAGAQVQKAILQIRSCSHNALSMVDL